MLGGLCFSDGISLPLGLECVYGLCLLESITLLLGLECVGWSLLVR